MKRFLFLSLLLVSFPLAGSAQDLGSVAPRTFIREAFHNISCAGGEQTAIIPDRGLNAHMVVYYTTGPINSIELGIDGSFDNVTYVSIVPGNSFTHPVGSNFAKIYMPYIRIHLYNCSGSGTIEAWYSGTWALDPWAAQPIPPSPSASVFCPPDQLCEWDDFIGGGVAAGTIGKEGWSYTSSTTQANANVVAGDGFTQFVADTSSTFQYTSGHPGQLEILSGDNAGGCILEVAISSPGTLYTNGDTLTLSATGGFGDGTATVQVTGVNGGGGITSINTTPLACGTNYLGWTNGGTGFVYNVTGGTGSGAHIEAVHSTYARSQGAIFPPSDVNTGDKGLEFDPSGNWDRKYIFLPGRHEGTGSDGFENYAVGLISETLVVQPSPEIFGLSGAYFYADTTFGNTVTAVAVGSGGVASGTGYAVGQVLTIDPAWFSDPTADPYGVGATVRVASVNGGGGITGLTLLTGGLSGYFITDTTGASLLGGTGVNGKAQVTDFKTNFRFFDQAENDDVDLDTGVNSQLTGAAATGAYWTQFEISHNSGDSTVSLLVSNAKDRSNITPLGSLTAPWTPLPDPAQPFVPLSDLFQALEVCPVSSGGTQGVVDYWQGLMTNLTE